MMDGEGCSCDAKTDERISHPIEMLNSREANLQEDSIARANKQVLLHKWALALVLVLVLISGPEVGLAKGLVGKLPGNPASCPEEPCSSDPQHVLRALKHTSYFVGVIFLMPILLYYASKLFSKLRDCFRGGSANKKPVDKEAQEREKKKGEKLAEGDGESECGELKSDVKQQVFASRNSAQSERHKSASLLTTGSSLSSGAQVRQSLQLTIGKQQQQQQQQFDEFARNLQLAATPTRPSPASRPTRERYSIMGPPTLAPGASQFDLATAAGSKSSSAHLAGLGDASDRYNLAQHRYSMFIGSAPQNGSGGECGPGFGPLSPREEFWQQREKNNYNDERADLEAASSLRRASLRRQRQVNSPLSSVSPDLNNGPAPHSATKPSSKRRHKVFPADGMGADELDAGRPDSSISAGSRKQRQEAPNGHPNNNNNTGHTQRNVNDSSRRRSQRSDWPLNNEEAEFANRLEVPLELGPQHRHSIDGSILNNMLLLAASGRPLDCDASERGGEFGGETSSIGTNEQPAKRRPDDDERATKSREQLDLFRAHQRQLAQLQQLQVSSFLDDAPPLGHQTGRHHQNQNHHQQQQQHNSSSRQKQRHRNGTGRRQLPGGGSPTAAAIANSAHQQRQSQLFLVPRPLARERRPSLNAAALRPGAGQRNDFA